VIKVPDALIAMGHKCTILNETDITIYNLQQYDAVIIGACAL